MLREEWVYSVKDKHPTFRGFIRQTFIPKSLIPDFAFDDCDGLVVSSVATTLVVETAVFKGRRATYTEGVFRKRLVHTFEIADYTELYRVKTLRHDEIVQEILEGKLKLNEEEGEGK